MPGLIRKIASVLNRTDTVTERLDAIQLAVGRLESRSRQTPSLDSIGLLQQFEFQVYSQGGEDGVIDYLTGHIVCKEKRFVEFGVQNYQESNTRFLLRNRNWSGLVMDGNRASIESIKSETFYWQHDLCAICAFVTRENINDLLRSQRYSGEIGLLSIDIDGNDYWIWQAIDVVKPSIVVIEYNHRFGPERSVTVPYAPDFSRFNAHYSGVYFGASLEALRRLGSSKGYRLVGCTTTGVNAFFVRNELCPEDLPALSSAQAYVRGKFREARDANGSLTYLDPLQEAAILEGLQVVEV